MATTVINVKAAPAGWRNIPLYLFIGRPSYLGNPYKIGRDGDRDEVIQKYSEHLALRRKTSPAAWDLYFTTFIKDHILVCYCSPEPCHGDVLARIADTEY